MTDNMFEINNLASRILDQKVILCFSLTASPVEGQLMLDDFEIRSSKDETIVTKMANTILHNVSMAIEDSKNNGNHFNITRYSNSFKVSCKGTKALTMCTSIIKQEMKRTHDKVMKCKSDIKKIADEFGTETIQHVLVRKQMQSI